LAEQPGSLLSRRWFHREQLRVHIPGTELAEFYFGHHMGLEALYIIVEHGQCDHRADDSNRADNYSEEGELLHLFFLRPRHFLLLVIHSFLFH
jgi:hypothetical protein